jgi:LPS sulfotransferase NodH
MQQHRPPCHFVILASQRTGSSYLQTLLSACPGITCCGELFARKLSRRRQVLEKQGLMIPPVRRWQSAAQYLEHVYFPAATEHGKAAGFKLLYEQPLYLHSLRWRDIFSYIRDRRVKVIHLRRRNLLDRYVSLCLARQEKKFGRGLYQGTVELTKQGCLRDFRECESLQARYARLLSGGDILHIDYEELDREMNATLARILAFVEVPFPQQPLTSSMIKQRGDRSQRDLISNYDAVKAALAGTRWQAYFTD